MPPPAIVERVDLDAEGPLQGMHAADRAHQEPVRGPLGDGEPALRQVRDDGRLLGGVGRVERVELVLGEELMVPRRPGILDVREEGLERLPLPERQADDHPMPVGAGGAAAVARAGEERRDHAVLHDAWHFRAGGTDRGECHRERNGTSGGQNAPGHPSLIQAGAGASQAGRPASITPGPSAFACARGWSC